MQRFSMIVTVGLVLVHEDKILMLRRSGTGWYDGYYALPAGCVDGNEPVKQAMIREAREEANLHLLPEWLDLGCVMHTRMMDRRSIEAIDFFFVSNRWENEIANNEPHKHDQLQFYPLDNLPQPIVPFMAEGIKRSLQGHTYGEFGF